MGNSHPGLHTDFGTPRSQLEEFGMDASELPKVLK